MGHGGALVDSTPFVRRVVGSPRRVLVQVLHSQLPVALWCTESVLSGALLSGSGLEEAL